MTQDNAYGSRPDLLPRSLVKVVRASPGSDRLLMWVGQTGVQLLGQEEDLKYQRESLNCYSHNSSGTIDWEAVDKDLIIYEGDRDDLDPVELIKRYVSNASILVFLWSNALLPSVRMTSGVAMEKLPGVVQSIREFWIYSPEDKLVIEYPFLGSVTVARVCTHA